MAAGFAVDAHGIASTRCARFAAAAQGSGQNSTRRVILPCATVKKEMALAICTPSVTVTSETASDSPATRRLIVNCHRPCAGYSRFMFGGILQCISHIELAADILNVKGCVPGRKGGIGKVPRKAGGA